MRTFRRLLSALILSLLVVAPAWAQTAVTETTLSNAITGTTPGSTTNIVLASASSIAVARLIWIDRELMRVRPAWVSGTTIPVDRGVNGTAVTTHSAGAIVRHAPAAAFGTRDYSGACTSTAFTYLPIANTDTGARWDCPSTLGFWVNLEATINVPCHFSLFTDSIDSSCFTADRPYAVYSISYVSKTAESGGTLTVIPRKQTTTQAPASGTALATAISGVSTAAETVTAFTLSTTASDLLIATGNRLGIDFTDDVAGELAGVTVTFRLVRR